MKKIIIALLTMAMLVTSAEAHTKAKEKSKMAVSESLVKLLIEQTKATQGVPTRAQVETIIKRVADKYQPEVDAYGINLFALAKAHAKIESDFNPYDYLMETIGGVPSADVSLGLFQVLTNTFRGVMGMSTASLNDVIKVELNPEKNAEAGIKYIVSRVKKYYNTIGLEGAIRTYNSGSPLTPASKFYNANLEYGRKGIYYYNLYYKELTGTQPTNTAQSPTIPPMSVLFSANNIVVGVILGGLAIWLFTRFTKK